MTPPSNWSVLAESVVGTSHLARAVPCQDAWQARRFGESGEWVALAVADGAGSAAQSEVGAAVACDALLSALTRRWPAVPRTLEAATAIYQEAREAVLAEAGRLGTASRELACTALLGLAGPDFACFAQLGDGAVVVEWDGGYSTPVWVEAGEYVNETDFLTGDRVAEALQFAMIEGRISGFALLTDGLQNLAIDFAGRRPHAGFFRPFFASLGGVADPEELREPLRGFLGSDRVNLRTDDDKTLALALRRP